MIDDSTSFPHQPPHACRCIPSAGVSVSHHTHTHIYRSIFDNIYPSNITDLPRIEYFQWVALAVMCMPFDAALAESDSAPGLSSTSEAIQLRHHDPATTSGIEQYGTLVIYPLLSLPPPLGPNILGPKRKAVWVWYCVSISFTILSSTSVVCAINSLITRLVVYLWSGRNQNFDPTLS